MENRRDYACDYCHYAKELPIMSDQEKRQDKLNRQSGIRLALETGMRVSLSLDGARENDDSRLSCELVGLVHFEFLILRLPWVPGLRQRLLPGNRGTLRFVSEGELYGFHVEIINHVAKPALMLFLAYPEVVETLSLRKHKRMICALPASVHSRRGEGLGIIQDLSMGGCRLVMDVRGQAGLRQMIVGDELLLQISLSTNALPPSVSSVVRSVSLETSRITLGLSFVDADDHFRKALSEYLNLSDLLA